MNEESCPLSAEQHTNIKTYWREDDTCSYCGSISSESLFKYIEDGCEIIPTDKTYKVYIKIPNPRVGQPYILSSANFKPDDSYELVTTETLDKFPIPLKFSPDYIGRWVKVGSEPEITEVKFYFEHFNDEDKIKFVDLLNQKKINIGYPGHFYVKPFFIM